jgi:hypothetical protein
MQLFVHERVGRVRWSKSGGLFSDACLHDHLKAVFGLKHRKVCKENRLLADHHHIVYTAVRMWAGRDR